ncbi:hypothetical protein CNX65_06370 [Actinosynnema pretiosum]|uniref:Insertion element IS402-like domain-containing protein n=2 Tax=Actinosynnema pretiosum TaxID=42197 RepID=A0A290Z1W3_9PSEU|nr:hypothetical protein CNX65_06370 [Actinosynnema pretiosum]
MLLKHDLVVDAILYTVENGRKWRAPPADFPPRKTFYQRFTAWKLAGVSQRLLDILRDRARLKTGLETVPSAAVSDSQSLRAASTVGRDSRGWDSAKKVQGYKRHIMVNTTELLIMFHVLQRRWMMEWTLTWITSNQFYARDCKFLPSHHKDIIRWAVIRTIIRRLTPQS